MNLQAFKQVIDSMISSDKLAVVANTLPLYLLTQMFFDGEQLSEQGIIGMTKNIFD